VGVVVERIKVGAMVTWVDIDEEYCVLFVIMLIAFGSLELLHKSAMERVDMTGMLSFVRGVKLGN
jgi:hypothetical protein